MTDIGTNPYNVCGPITDGDMFFGRRQAIDWLSEHLEGPVTGQPITISGSPALGKSSLINYLKTGCLGPALVVFTCDFGSIRLDDMTKLLWSLSKSAAVQLRQQGVHAPSVEKRMFILRPMQTFRQQFLKPLAVELGKRRLLLAFDNFEVLAGPWPSTATQARFLALLHSILQELPYISCVASIAALPEGMSPDAFFPLTISPPYRLGPLTPDEAFAMMREPVPYRICDEVAKYVYNLTAGHPRDLQLICHALYERWRLGASSHITLSDVIDVLDRDLSQEFLRGPVYQRRITTPPYPPSPSRS